MDPNTPLRPDWPPARRLYGECDYCHHSGADCHCHTRKRPIERRAMPDRRRAAPATPAPRTHDAPPPLTPLTFADRDHGAAQRMAQRLGYTQYAYTSSSDLHGLCCLSAYPGQRPGVIINTAQFGLMFVQDWDDLGGDHR